MCKIHCRRVLKKAHCREHRCDSLLSRVSLGLCCSSCDVKRKQKTFFVETAPLQVPWLEGKGEKKIKLMVFFSFFLFFQFFHSWFFLLLFEKKGGTFNFTLRKLIVWRAVVFVPSGVENNTPSQHREILLPEISRCCLALHPFCLCVKPLGFFFIYFFCISVFCFLFVAIVPVVCNIVHLRRTTEFVVTCCLRAIARARMCRMLECRGAFVKWQRKKESGGNWRTRYETLNKMLSERMKGARE